MNQTTIFWPMIAQVALVYAMYGVLWSRRRRAVREGTTRPNQFKDRTAEPDISVSAANNILNQFELPVLFYAVCLALYVTNGVSYVALVFAWLFVAARIVTPRSTLRSTAFAIAARPSLPA